MRTWFAFLVLVGSALSTPIDQNRLITTLKPTSERIREHGYPAEEHTVETVDGYLVKMFRIPYSHKLQNQNSVRPAVLIQHGLFSCSDGWVAIGPDNALPFVLADLGYDVWLGNARGNSYSKQNTRLSVNHPHFWRFSWHEIGMYDLSAMIDYILVETNQKAIHYAGHSQGTSVFFVLMSMRPEYNEKIKTAHMLAPIGYMEHMEDKRVRSFAPYLGVNGLYSALFNSAQFIPRNDFVTLMIYNACGGDIRYPEYCARFSDIYEGEGTNTNRTAGRIIAETHPAGVSTDQILHYMQLYMSGYYRQFDFGTKKNMKMYNQPYPPDYEVERITSEVHFHYSDNDNEAAIVDVERLAARLPNLVMHHVEDPSWSHTDFIMAYKVKEVIYDKISAAMQSYEDRSV